MTYALFLAILITVLLGAIALCFIPELWSRISGIAILVVLFVLAYGGILPINYLIENDYKTHMEKRPACMKEADPSLNCLEEYSEWVKDSVEYRRRYFDRLTKIQNEIKENRKD